MSLRRLHHRLACLAISALCVAACGGSDAGPAAPAPCVGAGCVDANPDASPDAAADALEASETAGPETVADVAAEATQDVAPEIDDANAIADVPVETAEDASATDAAEDATDAVVDLTEPPDAADAGAEVDSAAVDVPGEVTVGTCATSCPDKTLCNKSTGYCETVDGKAVFIPEGAFLMGTVAKDATKAANEKPQHTVYTDAFFLDRFEVTVGAYEECMVMGPCTAPSTMGDSCTWNDVAGLKTHPVNCVTWSQASAYCAWAGGRLPTEAEWERAARGGVDGFLYVWGDDWPPPGKAANYADVSASKAHPGWAVLMDYDDGFGDTAPVGQYKANAFGLYDMAGNVAEWVADWFDETWYASSPAWNPKGPAQAPSEDAKKVLRGASYHDYDMVPTRTSNRMSSVPEPGMPSPYVGFRCARTPGG